MLKMSLKKIIGQKDHRRIESRKNSYFRRIVLGDGTIIEAVAFKIPKSRNYPQGTKYSFQHYDPITGKTILRYDNHRQH